MSEVKPPADADPVSMFSPPTPEHRSPERSRRAGVGSLVAISAVGLCIVAIGIAWAYSLWAQQRAFAQPIASSQTSAASTDSQATREPDPELERLYRYGDTLDVTTDSLTPEVTELLQTLSASLGSLSDDINATEAKLRSQDPHLDAAAILRFGPPMSSKVFCRPWRSCWRITPARRVIWSGSLSTRCAAA